MKGLDRGNILPVTEEVSAHLVGMEALPNDVLAKINMSLTDE